MNHKLDHFFQNFVLKGFDAADRWLQRNRLTAEEANAAVRHLVEEAAYWRNELGEHFESLVDAMFESGADIDAGAARSAPPIFLAIRNHDLEMVKFLLARDADTKERRRLNFYFGAPTGRVTPLEYARICGAHDVAAHLEPHRAWQWRSANGRPSPPLSAHQF